MCAGRQASCVVCDVVAHKDTHLASDSSPATAERDATSCRPLGDIDLHTPVIILREFPPLMLNIRREFPEFAWLHNEDFKTVVLHNISH